MSLSQVAEAMEAEIRLSGDSSASTVNHPRLMVERISTDSRDLRPGDLFIAIRGERFDGHAFVHEAIIAGAAACVCDAAGFAKQYPSALDASAPCLIVRNTIEAMGRFAAHYRNHVMDQTTRVVAVTGSNGKTTTKGMIDHVLSASHLGRASLRSFNNDIGVPLTLLSAEAGDRYLVVEIGSNAPGEVAHLAGLASPDVGVITSIGTAHLEGLGGIEGVAAEKASLLDHLRPGGLAVVNVDHSELSGLLKNTIPISSHVASPLVGDEVGDETIGSAPSTRGDATFIRRAVRGFLVSRADVTFVSFGRDTEAMFRVVNVRGDARGTRFELIEGDASYSVELRLPGLHHATNAAAAFAVARRFGIEAGAIVERLRSFQSAEGRTRVFDVAGVTLVDDSYNANPASMLAAIETLAQVRGGRRVLVLGDMLELGDHAVVWHERVIRTAVQAGIEVVVTVGPLSGAALQVARRSDRTTTVVACDDAANVSDAVVSMLKPGDRVWIKGSRAMRLERVVDDLRASLGGRYGDCGGPSPQQRESLLSPS